MVSSSMRRGVWLFPGTDAGRLVDAVVAAEDEGLDEIWVADEGVSRDPMAVLAAAAVRTVRIRLGVGVTSPVVRHPAVLAATAATVDEISGGRAVLGFGVGGEMTLGPLGLSVPSPLTALRDALTTARAVLSGTATEGYWPPAHAISPRAVPLWIGARGPKLVELAARHADGLLISGCTGPEAERGIGILRDAGTGCEVALYHSVAPEGDDRTATWAEAPAVLDELAAAHRPGALGINLVELLEGHDPVDAVRRAAAVLRATR